MRHFRGSIPFGRRCAILFFDRTLFFSEREYLILRILQYVQSESKMKKDVQIERVFSSRRRGVLRRLSNSFVLV